MMRSQSLSRMAEITAGRSSISPRIIVTLPVSTPTALSSRSLSATSKITGRSPRSSNIPVAYAPTRPVPPVIKIPFFAIRVLLSRYRYNKLIRRVNLIFRRTWQDSGGRYLDLLGGKMIAFSRQGGDTGVTKNLLAMMLVLAGSLSFESKGLAQEKMRLAWAGFSPTNSPIWVIEDRKLLQKMGVQPEIIAIGNSPTVLQALLAGEIDASSISVTTLTSSRLAGADTVMIVGVVPTFVDHIVSVSNITTVEQLKGKTGGVNRLGTTSDLGLRLALTKLGIEPDKDVKIIPTGGTAERFAALSKGITQFTIIPEPFVAQAEKLGLRNLYNISDLRIPFWWNGILSREAIVKSKRPLMLKLARATVEAIHIIKTEKAYAISLFKKNLGVSDPEGLERAYRDYSNAFPEVPYPTPDGVKTMLDYSARTNPKAATADPKTFVDPSLIQELDSSGFIKQLYRK